MGSNNKKSGESAGAKEPKATEHGCSNHQHARPHLASETGHGNNTHMFMEAEGECPTLLRDRPYRLSWDEMSNTAKNMYSDMAKFEDTEDQNRFQSCVEGTLSNWALKMESDNPNRLPDGNPTYVQDDIFPVIKAFVNRVPRPGVTGSPIPPALSMADLEALDFLHHHQALPYQQKDYDGIFEEIPDGFIWHPIQTLVGIRGIDHRTLYEFRAFKHFWAIHKDDNTVREVSTEDDQTFEVGVLVPGDNGDNPRLVAGGFHNLMIPPEPKYLKKSLLAANAARTESGKVSHPPVMYVRFANNEAKILQDHVNHPMVFAPDGVPHMPEIGTTLPYTELQETDDFMKMFTGHKRVVMYPLPEKSHMAKAKESNDNRAPVPQMFPEKPDTGSTSQEGVQETSDTTINYVGDIPIITKKLPGGEISFRAERIDPESSEKPQRIHVPEFEASKKKGQPKTGGQQVTPARAKVQLGPADLSAIDAKIKQLAREKDNPRILPPVSKLAAQYTLHSPTCSQKSAMSNAAVASSSKGENNGPQEKGSKKVTKDGKPNTTEQTHTLHGIDSPDEPDPRIPLGIPGAFFASHTNRAFLVKQIDNKETHPGVPPKGPGARSWLTAKEEITSNPIKPEIMSAATIEHIKNIMVVSLQQTVYYHVVMSEYIKKEKMSLLSPEATCLSKVNVILEQGQRLIIEHATVSSNQKQFVRAIGTPKEYDKPKTGEKGKAKANANITLTTQEQACYSKLIQESKDFWLHPIGCGCRRTKK